MNLNLLTASLILPEIVLIVPVASRTVSAIDEKLDEDILVFATTHRSQAGTHSSLPLPEPVGGDGGY